MVLVHVWGRRSNWLSKVKASSHGEIAAGAGVGNKRGKLRSGKGGKKGGGRRA